MAEKRSWKFYLVISICVLFVLSFGFFFSSWGTNTMKSWLNKSYEESPPIARVTLPAADRWLTLAFYRGNILMDREGGLKLYEEWLGIQNAPGKDFWTTAASGRPVFQGKFEGSSKEGYTGWGPLHPRACDAFFDYLQLYAADVSDQKAGEMALNYHLLFYKLYPRMTKVPNLPHPQFYKYWDKIETMYIRKARLPVPHVGPKPPNYEGPIGGGETK